MTSMRLGITALLVLALWSLTGLGWLAPSSAPSSVLSVSSAQAGFSSESLGPSYLTEGDPDDYANEPEGDPDDYGGSAGSDTTGNNPQDDPSEESSSNGGGLMGVIASLASFFSGIW